MKNFVVCQCVALYQIDGIPQIDIIDPHGRLFEGCSIVNIGGGGSEVRVYPQSGVEVLATFEGAGSPYIIGVLEDPLNYTVVDSPNISTAGEYNTDSIAIKDVSVQAGGARLVCSDEQEAIYASPRLRAQGKLEISNGGTPSQSVAVAEPLLENLTEYQAFLDAIRVIINENATTLIDPLIAQYQQAGMQDKVIELTLARAQLLENITPPHDTIASEIAKIER